MKGKLTITISIGLTAVIFATVMFAQFKTVEQTNITEIESMRESELRTELSSWKSKYDEINLKYEEISKKVEEYKQQMKDNADATALIKNDIAENEKYLGYSDVEGEGLVITLEDNSKKEITSDDLLNLVNQLKLAGAEAISINDERVVNTTDITIVNGAFVFVNGKRLSSPYTVKVIGNQKYLDSAISIKYGYIDEITANGKTISYVPVKTVKINKYKGDLSMKYAE